MLPESLISENKIMMCSKQIKLHAQVHTYDNKLISKKKILVIYTTSTHIQALLVKLVLCEKLSKWFFLGIPVHSTYGKFFFSLNTLAVQTPKFILKLLLKTFSFSSNGGFFLAFEFLILQTLKYARNNAWTSQNMPNL